MKVLATDGDASVLEQLVANAFGLAFELFSYRSGGQYFQIWAANPWMDRLHKNSYWWRDEIIERIHNLLIARPA